MNGVPSPEPFWFGDPETPLFGWLHRPAGPPRLAVVLCNPFGHEASAAYRTLRSLAKVLAGRGALTLRFDYRGTGNSSGDTHAVGGVADWREDILAALAVVRRLAPSAPSALVGLRLGALLALDAAAASDGISALVLIAPPLNGRQFLRELTALDGAGVGDRTTGDELFGFPMSPALRRSISELDLAGKEPAGAAAILAIDRAELALGPRLDRALAARCPTLETVPLPGIDRLLADPHEAEVPALIVERTAAWLLRHGRAAIPAEPTGAAGATPADEVTFRAKGVLIRERALFLDGDPCRFGLLTTPADQVGGTGALVLASSGANPTSGPNRLYVSIARHLAALGLSVLRLDIAGIGDSAPHAGEAEGVIYPPRGSEDLARAVEWVRGVSSVPVVAGGLCSGAYHALRAASEGARVDGIVMINPLTFSPVSDWTEAAQPFTAIREAQRYSTSLRSPNAWLKLLAGRVSIRSAAHVALQRLGSRARWLAREALRRTPWRRDDDLAFELGRLARKDVRILFVFAAGDPGPQLLAEYGGGAVRALARDGGVTIVTIEGPDHTFSRLAHQRALVGELANNLAPAAGLRDPVTRLDHEKCMP